MLASRVTVVANQPGLARALETHLQKTLGQPVRVCSFDSFREFIGLEAPGILVLAATGPADIKSIMRLVQEISLQKWPAELVTVRDEEARLAPEWASLGGYVAHQLRWPADALGLTRLAQAHWTSNAVSAELIVPSSQLAPHWAQLRCTPSMWPLCDRLTVASARDVPVVFGGETGTGKSYLARLIHRASPRQQQGFQVVPCGAMVSALLESELFGHAQGPFSGASQNRIGRLAAAGNGTLLLDEIEALDWGLQAKLLNVLDTGRFEPIGSKETQICRARIMVASNANLGVAVEQGKFRRDLYHRLNVLSFDLPPLRQRAQDIEPLVRGLAARFTHKFQKDLFEISSEVLAALQAFPWPGNIRQLENAVQQAVLSSKAPVLLLEHLPSRLCEVATTT
jgi:DNA-binding NtrC family response regulator